MKHFRSEHAFEKYRPHVSWRERLRRLFRKKQYAAPTSYQQPLHYKSNPFRAPKKPSTLKFKLIVFLTAILGWLICLLYLPYFNINKIEYFGLQNNTASELTEVISANYLDKKSKLPLSNYFFIPTDKVIKDLQNKFSFENIQIKKVFPSTLEVTVTEKISSVIYDDGHTYFLLDKNGTAIKYLTDVDPSEVREKFSPSTTISFTTSTATMTSTVNTTMEHTPNNQKINQLFGNYPIVYDKRGAETALNETNLLPDTYISAIITWQKYLEGPGKMKPKFFSLDNLNSGIIIVTNQPWQIIFQPKNNIEAQINTLKEILPTIKPGGYVDLRFGEKVYWK